MYAMRKCKVSDVGPRSVRLELPGNNQSDWIGTSKLHRKLGIALISIGDFDSEDGLITPLGKSILQFCRLLLPDDQLATIKVRSIAELSKWWGTNHAAYTHIVLIGHGDSEAIYFGLGGARKPDAFQKRLGIHKAEEKLIISLCCETGKAPFAKQFSSFDFCSTLIGPAHSIHGAVGSHFLQTFLSLHLLQGKSVKIAFNNANNLMPGPDRFAIWTDGAKRA